MRIQLSKTTTNIRHYRCKIYNTKISKKSKLRLHDSVYVREYAITQIRRTYMEKICA